MNKGKIEKSKQDMRFKTAWKYKNQLDCKKYENKI